MSAPTNASNPPADHAGPAKGDGNDLSGETESESSGGDRAPEEVDPNQSGYDVIHSAASPHTFSRPRRWDTFVLFNIAIPILLILAAVAGVRALGTAEAVPLPPPDTSRVGLLQSLPPARVVQVQSLKESGRTLELVVDGTVVPFREARVASEVAGKVIYKSDNCEAGSIVKKGEVLMRIDPTDNQLEVDRIRSLLEQEYRALGEVDQEMTNAGRSIEIAQQDVKLAQKEVDRQSKLGQFASQKELDQSKSSLLKSSQQLLTLQNQLALFRTKRSRLEASEQLAATQLRSAEVNLRRCEITAPIDGVIVSEQAELDSFVNRGTLLMTIEDINKVEVAANMRMDQLHWVVQQAGERSKLQGYDLPDTPAIIEYEVAGLKSAVLRWPGTLVSFDGIGIDPNTRTVPVRLVVSDPKHYLDGDGNRKVADQGNALVRGMFVRVRLQLEPKDELVVVPGRSLRPGNRVWKFRPDEKVLDQMVAEAVKAKAEAAASQLAAEPSSVPKPAEQVESIDAKAETFDPAIWSAGLVRYSEAIFPIDSLRLTGQQEIDPKLAPSLQTAAREWVCETKGGDLKSGDYVVVSPLDAIPPEGLAVRTELTPVVQAESQKVPTPAPE